MGGKSPAAPKPIDPMEQARAQMAIDEANANRAAQAQAAERQRLADEDARKRGATVDANNRAYSTGQQFGATQLGQLGFADTYGVMDRYNTALSAAKGKVPGISDDVGSYYDYNTMWNNAKNEAQGAYQSGLDRDFRTRTPANWTSSADRGFADTADDAILDAILGEQYGRAYDSLEAARARGQLSEGGFNSSKGLLDERKSGARSQLEDIGLGVLGGYRDELGGIGQQFSDSITNYKLGQNINLGDFDTNVNTRRGALTGRMAGDVRNAVGDTSLFDAENILARGASAAGVSNNPLRNAFFDELANDPTRTTGTTGVF